MAESITLPMVCCCGGRAEALDAKVAEGDWSVDKLIYTLQWVASDKPGYPYEGTLSIVSDQWMRVTLTLTECIEHEASDEWREVKKISVECDRMLDGLLRLHEHVETGQ